MCQTACDVPSKVIFKGKSEASISTARNRQACISCSKKKTSRMQANWPLNHGLHQTIHLYTTIIIIFIPPRKLFPKQDAHLTFLENMLTKAKRGKGLEEYEEYDNAYYCMGFSFKNMKLFFSFKNIAPVISLLKKNGSPFPPNLLCSCLYLA